MTKEWLVLDDENNTVWIGRDDDDKPQVHKSFAAAEKRARQYAKTEPGKPIRVVGVEAVVICDVAQPRTTKIK